MLTLYFCPGACSMAAHVALEETGAPYERKPILIARNKQRADAYLAINPRGQVPALVVDGKVITETVGVLTYVARAFPNAKLFPADDVGQAQCVATMAWIASQVDPLFRAARPERFVADAAAQPAVKEAAQAAYWAKCQEIDTILGAGEWIAGNQYTACDPYALVYYGWGFRLGLPMQGLAAYTRHKDQLLSRPAVRRVLEREQHPLLA
ncbi:MAG TPA: glutathione S-transferase family protein [Stellaceae bacterium]|nr:glutathione S-transferase family protein [Stellaceae bacterium]